MASKLRYCLEINGRAYTGTRALATARDLLARLGMPVKRDNIANLQAVYRYWNSDYKSVHVWRERRNTKFRKSQYLVFLQNKGMAAPRRKRRPRAA